MIISKRRSLVAVMLAVLVAGCTGSPSARDAQDTPAATVTPNTPGTARTPGTATATAPNRGGSTPPAGSPSLAAPARFDAGAALRTVGVLAGEIGPREATSPAYRRAASHVEGRLRALGYVVQRQPFRVPAGVSWGVRVPAGATHNVVAMPRGFDPAHPHVIVGAHLDTVPQAPGAEDNASGVAVLLELARLAAAPGASAPGAAARAPAAAASRTAVPVVFVAFGAEEPRGPADDEHHFGSLHYVGRMPSAQRRALTGMVALDRVGVGPTVRVCTGGRSPLTLARDLRAAASRVKVRTQACENRTSDHWPFEKAGETVARLGGHPYAAYHSARDRPAVVSRAQLDRTGRVMWEFLTG